MTTEELFDLMRSSPEFFRKTLTIPAAHGPAKLADVMAPFQAADFAALDRGFIPLARGERPEISRFWLERTKGASKDSDLAVMLLWLLAFSQRPLACVVGAADEEQANELRKAAKSILHHNGWLAALVKLQAKALVNERTGGRADFVTSDAASAHGTRPDVTVLNELSHVADREFCETLLDNSAKMPGGLVVVMSNAGWVDSWQSEWRENARTSERWHFSAYTEPAPWLDPAEIKEAERRNPPARFARLWRGVWQSGSGWEALNAEDVAAALRCTGPMLTAEAGYSFFGGLDLAWRQDNSALAVVGIQAGGVAVAEPEPEPESRPRSIAMQAALELGLIHEEQRPEPDVRLELRPIHGSFRSRLAHLRAWKPPGGKRQLDLTQIETAVLEAHQRFGFTAVAYDPAQAVLLAQRLQRRGVPMVEVPQVSGNLQTMATLMVDSFTSGHIDLYPDEALLAELRALRLFERGDGGFRLVSPRTKQTGHGDRATALQLALFAAKKHPPRPLRLALDGAPLFLAGPGDFDSPPENHWFS